MHQNDIRLFLFQYLPNAVEDIGRHIKQRLLVLHDGKIIVRRDGKRIQHHVQHLTMLTCYTDDRLQFLMFFQFIH